MKKRRVWTIVLCLAAALLAATGVAFFRARATPFSFLSDARLVAWNTFGPWSHDPRQVVTCLRIFEVDVPMDDLAARVRQELTEQGGWSERWYDGRSQCVFSKDDVFVGIEQASVSKGVLAPGVSAIVYGRDATRAESWLGYVYERVPDRYYQWQ